MKDIFLPNVDLEYFGVLEGVIVYPSRYISKEFVEE